AENHKLPYYTLSPTYSVCADHGYLAGEQFECPICGKKTEVYSRITGYYRPVQNWNDGKAQEFKDRKVYDIGTSRLTHTGPLNVAQDCACAAPVAAVEGDKTYLFVTATCPNCKLAKSMLEKAGVVYETVMANENPELVNRYGVKQAPTLVVEDNVLKGVSEIKAYLAGK
ncbi:MAG: thioredoxin family protein, partial [Oscillospiraceae bacterium]|nr:thioredoxin family protein [Oscillospiraceae bacterium]